MSMFYGDKELSISEDDSSLLLQSLYTLAQAKSGPLLSGLALSTLDETKHRIESGFLLMGNVEKTALIGVGYLPKGIPGRVWFFINEGKPTLFIDGPGEIVEHLGLKYDQAKQEVYSPYNDLVLLTL